jgi:GNAT superfamily N-acetyltransferase
VRARHHHSANPVTADAWLDLGFARFIDMAVMDTALASRRDDDRFGEFEFRRAGPDDEAAIQALATELFRSFADPPIFVPFLPETASARDQFIAERLADDGCPHWLAVANGRLVAMQIFEEPTSAHWHQSLMQSPERGLYLFLACTVREARSTGVGAALFAHSMAWAREAGYERCAAHYLTASRAAAFWRGRGFQTISHWMSRVIDDRAVWARGRPG